MLNTRPRLSAGPSWVVALLFACLLLQPVWAVGSYAQSDNSDQPPADPCQEPYDQPSDACTLANGITDTHGFLRASGTSNVYQFQTSDSGVHVVLNLNELPADYDLYMFDDNGQEVAASVHEGTVPANIDTIVDQPGTYWIYVVSDPGRAVDPDNPYHLHVEIQSQAPPPVIAAPPVAAPAPELSPTAVPPTPSPVPQAPVTLSVTPADLAWTRQVTVSWANIPNPSADAWFELFRAEDVPGSRSTAAGIAPMFVSCLRTAVAPKASGSCTFPLSPSDIVDVPAVTGTIGRSATYEYRLFSDTRDNTMLARSNPIKLTRDGVVLDSGATISVSPSKMSGTWGAYSPMAATVTWANIPDPSALAWFAAFRLDDPLGNDHSSAAGAPALTFVSCIGGTAVAPRASGSCTLNVNPADVAGAPGKSVTIEFRLFSDTNNNTLLARSNPITLSATP